MTAAEVVYTEMFGCDSARIYKATDKLFLIIGHKRNTANDSGQWVKDGVPWEFEYLQETVIASGEDEEELLLSANEYKRLLSVDISDYLIECIRNKNCMESTKL